MKTNKAFIHIPRTGGTSLRVALRDCDDVQELDTGIEPDYTKRFFIGHFPYGYIEDASYYTILRDPLSRMISEYSYFGKEFKNDILTKRYADFDNISVRFLTGMKTGGDQTKERDVNEDDFSLACENLKKICFTFFDNSDNIEILYNKFYRLICTPKKQNKTIHLEIDEDFANSVLENNKYDLKLYNYAKELKENLNG